MKRYFAFGGCLDSEIELPDLSPSLEERVDWEFRITPPQHDIPEAVELQGTYEVAPGYSLKLYRLSDGLRLVYANTGTFDITLGGRRIQWSPGPRASLESVRALLLGPVMALALNESGILCLHGSAVAIDGRSIAFLAPKDSGKSTLALALTAAGGALISDDLVAIDLSDLPHILPGVHSVRVHEDVTTLVGSVGGAITKGQKDTLSGLPRDRVCWDPVPLAALYILRSIPPAADVPSISRHALSPVEASAAIALRTKLAHELIGFESTGSMLPSIVRLVSRARVQRLDVVRDLERLPEVVDILYSWESAPGES